jgi:dTDP-4-dehydrorhamnose reductase
MSRSSCLVIGGDGQVGRALRAVPANEDTDVTVLDRGDLDITDAARVGDVISMHKPDAVINGAAYTDVDGAEQDNEQAFAVNCDGPANLAAACQANGAALVHLSTDYVFDGAATDPYTEDDPVSPVSVYGESKAAGEAAVRDRLDRHVIVRTAWVFSPDGRNFVKSIVAAARRDGADAKPLRVVEDEIGGPTDAHSLASALLTIAGALAKGTGSAGTYHLAGAPSVSRYAFACRIVAAVESAGGDVPRVTPTTSVEYPTAARRPARAVLDCARARQVFGLEQPDWRASLPGVVERCMKAVSK